MKKNGKGNRGGSQESKKYEEKIRRMSLSPPLKMGAQQHRWRDRLKSSFQFTIFDADATGEIE